MPKITLKKQSVFARMKNVGIKNGNMACGIARRANLQADNLSLDTAKRFTTDRSIATIKARPMIEEAASLVSAMYAHYNTHKGIKVKNCATIAFALTEMLEEDQTAAQRFLNGMMDETNLACNKHAREAMKAILSSQDATNDEIYAIMTNAWANHQTAKPSAANDDRKIARAA